MLFPRIIGIVPLGIGLTLLGFLWMAPYGEFHSPPLFFRIFGSFVALFFVLFGAALVSGQATNPHRLRQLKEMTRQLQQSGARPASNNNQGEAESIGYRCTSCGAPLDGKADVSPHGDVKCAHCDRWFNIHSATT